MDDRDVHRIARAIFDQNMRRERFRPLRGADAPDSLETAYRIQDRVRELFETEAFSGPLGGHKIALTSKAVQELCGVDQPAYGPIAAKTIHASPVALKAVEYVRLGLEFEVAVEIDADISPDEAPFDRESISRHVAAVMPAFELIEDRNADYGDLDAASILTDRCWCAGLVHGPRVFDWHGLDLANAPVEAEWNGEVIDRGVAGDSMGHPFNGLAWVANHLAARGRKLHRGDIVMTGSALKTRFPEPGDRVVYRIAGLGEAAVRIEA